MTGARSRTNASTFVFDGLTARLLVRPGGPSLGDIATSLMTAVAGTFEGIWNESLKCQVGWADFHTGPRRRLERHVTLITPGWSPFMSPSERKELEGVPPMWGGVMQLDTRYELRLSGIRLSDEAFAVPHRTRGLLLPRVELPESAMMNAAGRRLGEVVEGLPEAAADLLVKRVRRARQADAEHIQNGPSSTPLVATAPGVIRTTPGRRRPDDLAPGIVVVVEMTEPEAVGFSKV